MFGARVLDLASSELTLLTQRAQQSTRPHPGGEENGGRMRHLVASVRRAASRVANEAWLAPIPRLGRYPY